MIYLKSTILLLFGLLLLVPATPTFAGEVKSGYEFIQPASRAMQDDDFENPGLIAVDLGKHLFNNKQNGATRSCAECHDTDGTGLNTKNIARYPVYAEDTREIVTLQEKISRCRDNNTGSNTLPANHPDLLALETFVRNRAIGEVVNVQTDGPVTELLAQGEKLFRTRWGLIDMSCYHCHDLYPGKMIRGQKISQGQGNGFPAYRLATGEITNLHQRIQQCLVLMRARPFDEDSEELKLMQLYNMSRSNGLRIETPAVRY